MRIIPDFSLSGFCLHRPGRKLLFFSFSRYGNSESRQRLVCLVEAIRGMQDRKGNGKMDSREERRTGEGAMMSRKGYWRKTER